MYYFWIKKELCKPYIQIDRLQINICCIFGTYINGSCKYQQGRCISVNPYSHFMTIFVHSAYLTVQEIGYCLYIHQHPGLHNTRGGRGRGISAPAWVPAPLDFWTVIICILHTCTYACNLLYFVPRKLAGSNNIFEILKRCMHACSPEHTWFSDTQTTSFFR